MNDKIKEIVKVLEGRQREIKESKPYGLTPYAEGKIDGIEIALREVRCLIEEPLK